MSGLSTLYLPRKKPAVLMSIVFFLLGQLFTTTLYATDMALFPMLDGRVHEGEASCTSSGCHTMSSRQQRAVSPNEYILREKKDAHSTAYKKLAAKDASRITDKLGLKAPQEEPVCLACHASNVPKKLRGKKFQLGEGLGCETCHGGAESWLISHTDKEVEHTDNIENGFYPVGDTTQRARLCMSCHFGNSTQFVSHAMMAAGHPRLSFEMNTFSEMQPPHFISDEVYKKRKDTYSNVQAWVIGQAVAADSVLKMLRSHYMQSGKVFPEPGLFDCQSCHHPISAQTRATQNNGGHSPGMIPLNDTSLSMLRHAIVPLDETLAWQLKKLLKELHTSSATGYIALFEKVDELQILVNELTVLVAEHEFTAQNIQEISLSLINESIWAESQDNVTARQTVMAIQALTTSWNKLMPFQAARRDAIRADIDKLSTMVADENSYNSKSFAETLRLLKGNISGR